MPRDRTARKVHRRGGAIRIRTMAIGRRFFRHIYVVRKPGPRGGRTVAGPIHKRKSSRRRHPRRKG